MISVKRCCVVGLVLVVALLSMRALYQWATNHFFLDQRMELVFVKWNPDLAPPSGEGLHLKPEGRLSNQDIAQLKALGLAGRARYERGTIIGWGRKSSRMLVVMQTPLRSDVAFPRPDATKVIYIQKGKDWDRYPPDAPTLKQALHLKMGEEESNRDAVLFAVEKIQDGESSGVAFSSILEPIAIQAEEVPCPVGKYCYSIQTVNGFLLGIDWAKQKRAIHRTNDFLEFRFAPLSYLAVDITLSDGVEVIVASDREGRLRLKNIPSGEVTLRTPYKFLEVD